MTTDPEFDLDAYEGRHETDTGLSRRYERMIVEEPDRIVQTALDRKRDGFPLDDDLMAALTAYVMLTFAQTMARAGMTNVWIDEQLDRPFNIKLAQDEDGTLSIGLEFTDDGKDVFLLKKEADE